MFSQGLHRVRDALNQKADAVQRDFTALGQQLQALGQQVKSAPEDERAPLNAQRAALYDQQRALAEAANLWRDRARGALRQQPDEAIRLYLNELLATQDERVRPAVEHMLHLLDLPEAELVALAQSQRQAVAAVTPVGRLIERARTAYELRGADATARGQAAFEFANRAGMAQNAPALAELEAGLSDPDPLVNELLTLTILQIHRFRALRLGDLDAAHASVVRLTRLTHPAVIPVLIEVAAAARTGFIRAAAGMVEADNERSRAAALARLTDLDTPETRAAVQRQRHDREWRQAQI